MNIPKVVHESWHEYLQPLFDDLKMSMVLETVSKVKYYPEKKDVFRVFAMPMYAIRVVILGQDPYPSGEATGLAFGVRPDKNTPKSLMIIKDEVKRSIYPDKDMFPAPSFYPSRYPDVIHWKTLEHWWKQGVFLLNTALTVQAKTPNSHTLIWQWFMREVVDIIAKKQQAVWMLWGSKAQSYESYIVPGVVVDNANIDNIIAINAILKAPHPVAEVYNPDTPYKFTGCNHFAMCNKILENNHQDKILW